MSTNVSHPSNQSNDAAKTDKLSGLKEKKQRIMLRTCIHVICMGLVVGFVDADQDDEPQADLQHCPPLHM